MRILHCCLALPYIPEGGYQETRLPETNRADGCEVYIAASPVTIEDGKYTSAPVGCFETESGIKVERLAYPRLLPTFVGSKLRIYPRYATLLEELQPDVIYHHGPQTQALLVSARYRKKHPDTVLIVDNHASFANSAKDFVSRNVLHRCYYRAIYNLAYKQIDRLYCVGYEEYDFALKMLRNDDSKMKLMPLGDTIISDEKRTSVRRQLRQQLGLDDDAILMLHTGKLSALKRTTTLLSAMRQHRDPRLRLYIIGGGMDAAVEEAVGKAAAEDSRIRCFRWMEAAELRRYMCAADIYMQPGTVSSSLHTAMCTGLGVMCRRHDSYVRLFGEDNGAIFADTEEEIAAVVGSLADGSLDIAALQRKASRFAQEHFDYHSQSEQFIYSLAEKR